VKPVISTFFIALLAQNSPGLALEPSVTTNLVAIASCQAGKKTDHKTDHHDPASASCQLAPTEGEDDDRSSRAVAQARGSTSRGVNGGLVGELVYDRAGDRRSPYRSLSGNSDKGYG